MSKISELSNGGALLATDDLIVVRSGGNVRAQLSAISGQSVSATTLAASGATTLGSTLAVTGTISATGNVGIGIAPSVKLEVNGGADGSVVFSGRSDGGNGNNQRFNLIAFADGGGSGYGGGLKIQTRNSSNVFSDAVTVTSAGNVGIGAASPSSTFRTSIYGDGSSVIGGIEFRNAAGGGSTFTIGHASAASPSATLNVVGAGNLTFNTNNTERVRLNSSGSMLINTTAQLNSSAAKIQVLQTVTNEWSQRVNNSANSPYGLIISYTGATPNATSNHFLYLSDATAIRLSVASNGGIYNYSGNNVNLSDRNAKKDITIHTDNEWNCVKAWEIVDYRYKDQADDSPAKIGVIAQQIQEHCPDLVNVFQEQADAVEEVLGEDGEVVTEAKAAVEERIGVNEAQMMWKVTKALQEAMTRIETLEAKVQTLENG